VLADLAHLAQPSLAALCALFVVLIATGRLVPVSTLRREVEAERRMCELQAKRADEQKARADLTSERADLLVEAIHDFLPYARNADDFMSRLQDAVDKIEKAI
jgi:hypothetical protein